MAMLRRKQRVLALAMAAALLASMALVSASSLAVVDQELLANGNFEGGFASIGGCGAVGRGWGCFTNGGSVQYGFFDDEWAPVVGDGKHSQGIALSTQQYAASESDRFAGLFQTVNLVQGAAYQLQLKGLMRETKPDPNDDKWRYRVQWGYTTDGSTDWTKVTSWVELPWDKIDERTQPSALQSFSTSFTSPSNRITLFLRVWKKWGSAYKELNVNLDTVSLFGPGRGAALVVPPPAPPAVVVPPAAPESGPVVVVPSNSGQVQVIPPAPTQPVTIPGGSQQAGVCGGPNYVSNGDFEAGFAGGAVGNYWRSFNNGGKAHYGFYDEQWSRVVKSGSHGQLIEINSRDIADSDTNRFAGIYQALGNLVPGASYEVSFWGLMREEQAHPEEDPYRYRVQWGYAPLTAGATWASINNWTDVPWDTIYLRTDPGQMLPFSAQFQAPANGIVLGIRALKKWGADDRELDVNLDAVRLARCQGAQAACAGGTCGNSGVIVITGSGPAVAQSQPGVIVIGGNGVTPVPPAAPGGCTWYTVKRGDTLSRVAASFGKTVKGVMQSNKIANANRIYAGQKLCIK